MVLVRSVLVLVAEVCPCRASQRPLPGARGGQRAVCSLTQLEAGWGHEEGALRAVGSRRGAGWRGAGSRGAGLVHAHPPPDPADDVWPAASLTQDTDLSCIVLFGACIEGVILRDK